MRKGVRAARAGATVRYSRRVSEAPHGAASVGAGYDQTAASYGDVVAHNRIGARRLVDGLPPGDYRTVVDVGCGTGFASLEMIRHRGTRHAIGVDPSPAMMEVFRAAAAELPDVTVDLRVGDAAALPVDDAAADAVVSTMAFHWFPDKAAALAEMARCVRPGGVVGVLTAGRGTDAELLSVMRAMDPPVPPAWTGVFDHIHRDVREMHELMRGAGLDPVDVWSETRWRSTPVEAYLARLQAVASHLSSDLPPEEARAHGERLGAALAARSGPDGFAYSFVKLFAVARRPG